MTDAHYWKETAKDLIESLPQDRATIRTYSEVHMKLVDAGEGHMSKEVQVEIIEIWYE